MTLRVRSLKRRRQSCGMTRCCWRLYQKPSSPSKLAHPHEWRCRVLPPSPNWIVAPKGKAPRRTRTDDIRFTKAALYPTELERRVPRVSTGRS